MILTPEFRPLPARSGIISQPTRGRELDGMLPSPVEAPETDSWRLTVTRLNFIKRSLLCAVERRGWKWGETSIFIAKTPLRAGGEFIERGRILPRRCAERLLHGLKGTW